MSSLNLSFKLWECKFVAGCVERVEVANSDIGTVGVDVSTFLALSTDFSRMEIREAMSAMMVSFARRFRGPNGGYAQGRPARAHDEHGSVLSHRIFLLLQP